MEGPKLSTNRCCKGFALQIRPRSSCRDCFLYLIATAVSVRPHGRRSSIQIRPSFEEQQDGLEPRRYRCFHEWLRPLGRDDFVSGDAFTADGNVASNGTRPEIFDRDKDGKTQVFGISKFNLLVTRCGSHYWAMAPPTRKRYAARTLHPHFSTAAGRLAHRARSHVGGRIAPTGSSYQADPIVSA